MVLADALRRRRPRLVDPGTDISDAGAAQRRSAATTRWSARAACPPELPARYCLKGVRAQAGHAADRPAAARARALRADQPEPAAAGAGHVRRDLPAQRDDLFRPDDQARRWSPALLEQLQPGGYFFVGHSESLQRHQRRSCSRSRRRSIASAHEPRCADATVDVSCSPGEFHFGDARHGASARCSARASRSRCGTRGRMVGGMCHFMLPARRRAARRDAARTAATATRRCELMFDAEHRPRASTRRPSARPSCSAAATCFPASLPARPDAWASSNIDAARELLRAHGIRIVAEHVGGTATGRSVRLWNGDVWLRQPRATDGRRRMADQGAGGRRFGRGAPGADAVLGRTRHRGDRRAADPLFALERMKQDWPDVIVLDVEMPRMDGITFLRKIMAERPTPVVICSTLTEKGAETTLRGAGRRRGRHHHQAEARAEAVPAGCRRRPGRRREGRRAGQRAPAGARRQRRWRRAAKLTADAMLPPAHGQRAMAADHRARWSPSAPPPAAPRRWKRC